MKGNRVPYPETSQSPLPLRRQQLAKREVRQYKMVVDEGPGR